MRECGFPLEHACDASFDTEILSHGVVCAVLARVDPFGQPVATVQLYTLGKLQCNHSTLICIFGVGADIHFAAAHSSDEAARALTGVR